MGTIWKTTSKANNTITGATITSWSRQQKLAMIAGFAILGLLLALSACSRQTAKPALVGVSGGMPDSNGPAASSTESSTAQTAMAAPSAPTDAAKKTRKRRPANVTYSDANSGVSFVYPRKFMLATGEKAQPQIYDEAVPMDFVEAGGQTLVTVAMPKALYPGTDFESGFLTVSVNRGLSAEQCSQFAFVEIRKGETEPVAPEKVKVGSTEMEMTDEFGGTATEQAEAQYYHNYENGACYEYVLGLGTGGYGVKEGIKPVDRNEVFARLEKILATVKVQPVAQETVAQEPAAQEEKKDADPALGADASK